MKQTANTIIFVLLLAGTLSSCRSDPPDVNSSLSPLPSHTAFEVTELPDINLCQEPPLTQEDLDQPVPEFLEPELQQLYRRTHNVYNNLFVETTNCEYGYTFEPGTFPEEQTETFEENGLLYRYSKGRYKDWEDFEALVHSVFTDQLFQSLNDLEGYDSDLYQDRDGKLCFVDLIKPNAHTRNYNFQDTFVLLEQTEDIVRFNVIGYYSFPYPLKGESTSQRNARLRAGYEYTEEFELVMVNTEEGWRFDTFYDTSVDASEYMGVLNGN